MTFLVRQIDYENPSHSDSVVRLLNAYAHDPSGEAQELSAEVADGLVGGLRDFPTALVWLAFHEAEAVGLAICFQGFSTFAARPLINIHDLVVAPEFRGRGVGRMLLAHIEEKARQMDGCKLTLEVSEGNGGAHKLYRSLGFGLQPNGEAKEIVLFMEKYL